MSGRVAGPGRAGDGDVVVVVYTRVRCTQDALWARGELTVDGVSLFDRVWHLPVGGAERIGMESS